MGVCDLCWEGELSRLGGVLAFTLLSSVVMQEQGGSRKGKKQKRTGLCVGIPWERGC